MANLPADLPEDWTSNQKITPNGTEVGLTPQHGYNYLMKQVNDAQNEINNIGTTIEEALTDVAKEASVQEIITSIGETDDTGGSTVAGTVMGKLNTLIDQDDMQSNKLDTVLTILGSGVAEYTSPGTYQLEIPAGITKIKVTACGGGGAGCSTYGYTDGNYNFGSAGSGGESIANQEYELSNTGSPTTLQIIVGAGGQATLRSSTSSSAIEGTDGGSTVIGNLVTLAGGKHGKAYSSRGINNSNTYTSTTTESSGQGSGNGGASVATRSWTGDNPKSVTGKTGGVGSTGNAGTPGSAQTTKTFANNRHILIGGGSGGGSLGNGGSPRRDVVGDDETHIPAIAPTRGGGGYAGGGAFYVAPNSGSANGRAGNGANGYVKIEWGI